MDSNGVRVFNAIPVAYSREVLDMKGNRDMTYVIVTSIIIIILFFAFGVLADAESEKEGWIDYIEVIAEEKNICPELIEAIIEQESSWDPKAKNGDCIGLMQVSLKWHRDRMERLGVSDLLDPYDNILVGIDYLAELFEKYEDPALVLMIYNGDCKFPRCLETGEMSEYASKILERSAELERLHGK